MSTINDRTDITQFIREDPSALDGYAVDTIDGTAATVTADQDRVDDQHLIVHVGNRLFGKDVVIELDAVHDVDTDARTIHVDRVSEWVKGAPKLSESSASI